MPSKEKVLRRSKKNWQFFYNANLTWVENAYYAMSVFRTIQDSKTLTSPEKFGPRFWDALHSLLSKYPLNPSEEEAQVCAEVFLTMKNSIPCWECRSNFESLLQDKRIVPKPIVEIARNSNGLGNLALNMLSWNLHNFVNQKTGKPPFTWSQYVEKYQPLVSVIPENIAEFYRQKNLL